MYIYSRYILLIEGFFYTEVQFLMHKIEYIFIYIIL